MANNLEEFNDLKENGKLLTLNTWISYDEYRSPNYTIFGGNTITDKNNDCFIDYLAYCDGNGNINIIIRKSKRKPATGSVKISVEYGKAIECVKNDWDEDIHISDIPIYPMEFSSDSYLELLIHISIELLWYGFKDEVPIFPPIVAGMANFFKQTDFSDLTITIGKEIFPVHKVVLAAQSNVFLKKFTCDMEEARLNETEISDSDAKIFKHVLEFCYTNKPMSIDNIENTFKIMKVADKYEISVLKDTCQKQLARKINIDNIFRILLMVDECNATELKTCAIQFMIQNKRFIVAKNDFNSEVLKRPELFIDFFVKSINDETTKSEMFCNTKKCTNLVFESSIALNKFKSPEYKSFGSNSIIDNNICCKLNYLAFIEDGKKLNLLIRKSIPKSARVLFKIYVGCGEGINKIMKEIMKDDWIDDIHILGIKMDNIDNGYGGRQYRSNSKLERQVHISVSMSWYGFNHEIPILPPIVAGMADFFSQTDLSDFTIIIDKEVLPVHKVVLAAQSSVFSKMFTSDLKESQLDKLNTIEINDIDVNVFKYILKFCYTNKAEGVHNVENNLKILKGADRYKILLLKYICEEELANKINLDNVFEILLGAGECNADQLKKSVIQFMIKNKQLIIRKKNFNTVALEQPKLFIDFFVKSISDETN